MSGGGTCGGPPSSARNSASTCGPLGASGCHRPCCTTSRNVSVSPLSSPAALRLSLAWTSGSRAHAEPTRSSTNNDARRMMRDRIARYVTQYVAMPRYRGYHLGLNTRYSQNLRKSRFFKYVVLIVSFPWKPCESPEAYCPRRGYSHVTARTGCAGPRRDRHSPRHGYRRRRSLHPPRRYAAGLRAGQGPAADRLPRRART